MVNSPPGMETISSPHAVLMTPRSEASGVLSGALLCTPQPVMTSSGEQGGKSTCGLPNAARFSFDLFRSIGVRIPNQGSKKYNVRRDSHRVGWRRTLP